MPRRRAEAAPPRDSKQRLIAAALDLAASQGWRHTSFPEIAAAAKVPLSEAHRLFRSKTSILAAFRRDLDLAVVAGSKLGAEESAHDRLFDVLMRRFEALKPRRQAVAAILHDSLGDPAALKLVPGVMRSMRWMHEAAGLPAAGRRGQIACKISALIYFSVYPAFLRDESEDLGSTMALLDRRLNQVGGLIRSFAPRRGRRAERSGDAS